MQLDITLINDNLLRQKRYEDILEDNPKGTGHDHFKRQDNRRKTGTCRPLGSLSAQRLIHNAKRPQT